MYINNDDCGKVKFRGDSNDSNNLSVYQIIHLSELFKNSWLLLLLNLIILYVKKILKLKALKNYIKIFSLNYQFLVILGNNFWFKLLRFKTDEFRGSREFSTLLKKENSHLKKRIPYNKKRIPHLKKNLFLAY